MGVIRPLCSSDSFLEICAGWDQQDKAGGGTWDGKESSRGQSQGSHHVRGQMTSASLNFEACMGIALAFHCFISANPVKLAMNPISRVRHMKGPKLRSFFERLRESFSLFIWWFTFVSLVFSKCHPASHAVAGVVLCVINHHHKAKQKQFKQWPQ